MTIYNKKNRPEAEEHYRWVLMPEHAAIALLSDTTGSVQFYEEPDRGGQWQTGTGMTLTTIKDLNPTPTPPIKVGDWVRHPIGTATKYLVLSLVLSIDEDSGTANLAWEDINSHCDWSVDSTSNIGNYIKVDPPAHAQALYRAFGINPQ